MSGDSPPPKPKPGSLRDRIAAFEQKPQQNAPPPPALRPKPGHVQWKPRQSSPPPPPVNSGEGAEGRHGMSTADAKESVGSGGMSLKERMAALQGKGAFAPPPVPTPAPKPVGERKWKPPPVPVASSTDDGKEAEHDASSHTTVKSPVSRSEAEASEGEKASESAGETEKATDADHPDERVEEIATEGTDDPEEEERKRRAAIAARLARLGGARIGMGPPVFAPKPRAPPKEEHHARENADEPATFETPEKIDIPNVPSESSLVSPDSASSGRSPPASMPVPSGPRRAAPPRRRPPKSPGAPSSELPPLPSDASKEEGVTPSDAADRDEKKLEEDEVPTSAAEEAEEEEKEETEEEAAARRKRIADRLAKSGGINPLAGPRPIQPTEDEEEREKEIAGEVGDGAEVEAHETEPVPTIVRVSSEAPEGSAAEAEEQEYEAQAEAEAEVPPRSPSEPDEEPQSQTAQAGAETIESEDGPPPLPSKLTSTKIEETDKHIQSSLSTSPTTPLPTKDDGKSVPVVDMSKPSEMGKTEDKLDDVKVTEGDSVDITEAAAEYKDVQTHPAKKEGETPGDTPPVPDKEVKTEVKDEKDH